MFFEELNPITEELLKQPIAFMGGVLAGTLRLNLNEDPLKTWLSEQGGVQVPQSSPPQNGYQG